MHLSHSYANVIKLNRALHDEVQAVRRLSLLLGQKMKSFAYGYRLKPDESRTLLIPPLGGYNVRVAYYNVSVNEL